MRWSWLWLVGVGVGAALGAEQPATTQQDNHKYYTLSVFQNNIGGSFDENFIDMENADVKHGLSDTMVGAELIRPQFPFPFYGHLVHEFYTTTHGFLSLSTRLHDFIYKTQYIAPLRIKLDPSRSNSSTISVLSLPERFTVEWSNVSVMEAAEHPSGGTFTFQVTLKPNGDIVFVYVEVQPVLTTAALYDHEPVAGISDAFLLHGSELHLYHKINIENVDINTRTVAVFRALPTCIAQTSCDACAALRETSTFSCMWCKSSGHCSDGSDRLRQAWDDHRCHLENTTSCVAGDEDVAVDGGGGGHTEWRHSSSGPGSAEGLPAPRALDYSSTSTVVSAVVSSLMVILLLILLLVFLFLYGKFNENTVIGRQVKVLRSSYHQFGAAKSSTSLELGKKKSEQKQQQQQKDKAKSKAAAKAGPVVSEFVNPLPMVNNNNVITANM